MYFWTNFEICAKKYNNCDLLYAIYVILLSANYFCMIVFVCQKFFFYCMTISQRTLLKDSRINSSYARKNVIGTYLVGSVFHLCFVDVLGLIIKYTFMF